MSHKTAEWIGDEGKGDCDWRRIIFLALLYISALKYYTTHMGEESGILNNISPFSSLRNCAESYFNSHKHGWIKWHKTCAQTSTNTHPQVSISQVWVVVPGVGAVDGLFAVNLNYAAVLNVTRVLQLVENITGFIFDQQSRAGRPECQNKSRNNQNNDK